MDDQYLSSSPDPISILADSSPAKPRKAGTPVRPKAGCFQSPSKSIVLDAQDPTGRSPWKIKVTVQAETGTDIYRNIKRRSARASQSTTIPIRDADQVSPIKRRGRPRKSNIPEDENVTTTRSKTPPRRRTRRTAKPLTKSRSASAGVDDGDDEATEADQEAHQQLQDTSKPQIRNVSTSRAVPFVVVPRQDRSFSPSPSTIATNDQDRGTDARVDDEDGQIQDFGTMPGEATTIESEEFSMISVDSLSSHHTQPNSAAKQYSTLQATKGPDASISYMPSSPPVHPQYQHTPQVMQTPQLPEAPLQSIIKFPHLMTPLRESAVRSGKVLQDIVRSPEREQLSSRDASSSNNLFTGFSANTRRQLRQSLEMGAALAEDGSAQKPKSSPLDQRSSSSSIRYPALEVSRSDHRLPTPDERDEQKSTSTASSGPSVYPHISPSMRQSVSIVEPSTNVSRRSYDIMSWAPTGPARLASPADMVSSTSAPQRPDTSARRPNVIDVPSDSSEDGLEDEDSDSEDDEHQSQDAADDEPTTRAAPQRAAIDEDADIWQEAANESVEADANDDVSALVEPPVVPRRSKIPGTWRRTSGNHFHYSDSPEPEAVEQRKVSSTESSGKESAVVTPPTTDDEEDDDPHDSFQEDDTKPDTTESADVDQQDAEPASNALSPVSEAISPEDEDTGVFWLNNLPSVFQGRRGAQHNVEISALSELQPISSPAKPTEQRIAVRPQLHGRSPLRMRQVEGSVHSNQQGSSVLSSPLRKTLLKSSKLGGSPVSKIPGKTTIIYETTSQNEDYSLSSVREKSCMRIEEAEEETSDAGEETPDDSEVDQGKSVASDTRQLLAELAAQNRKQIVDLSEHHQQRPGSDGQDDEEQTNFNTTYLNGSRSYVEKLNISSPAKIAVKFNDSSMVSQGIGPRPVLSPKKKQYHSLFDDDAPLGESIQSEQTDGTSEQRTSSSPAKPVSAPEESKSFVSRMTNSFWSTITTNSPAPKPAPTPEEPANTSSPSVASTLDSSASISPSIKATSHSPLASIPVPRDSTTVPGTGTSDSILRLRRKYGLLSPHHPFTLYHARTLHRLHSSLKQHPDTTLVPSLTVLPLPAVLVSLRGKTYTSSTFHTSLTWTSELLRVVNAFSYLLMPDEERAHMERNGEWGDEVAIQAKGWDPRGRHGTWFAFAGEGRGDKKARGLRGTIELGWVAEVLGEVVLKEERLRGVKGRGRG